MKSNNKDLLHLEAEASPLESKLLFCNRDARIQSQNLNPELSDKKPDISSVPKSQVLSKIKNFLGVLSEDNKNLELAAKNNPRKYDIEALTGEEPEYIEMDIMLGVAELHTQEAVSAAESAIAGYQPVINLATNDSDTESEDRSDEDEISDSSSCESFDDDDDDDDGASAMKDSSKKAVKRKRQSENRANIVELS